MSNYKTITMIQPPSGLDSIAFGFIGGCVSLMNSMPIQTLSTVGGAFVVAALLSFFSYVGKAAGVLAWKHIIHRYKNYKNKPK